jgi:hypothetical protein
LQLAAVVFLRRCPMVLRRSLSERLRTLDLAVAGPHLGPPLQHG